MSAERQALPGQRWHFQHGPIDIVIGADGEASAVQAAHEAAWLRFTTVLDELVCELPELRQPVGDRCGLAGPVARRMWQACQPYRAGFVTPMAAVAGSVAQELIEHYARPGIQRAWVNNGGDVALHLAPGESIRVGLFADLARFDAAAAVLPLQVDGHMTVHATLPVRGVATSGWRGRSFSLGIADSVTVLARTAAQADVAATLIANAVNVPDARIERRPANELRHDTDLGDRPVTFHVPPLDQAAVLRAVRAGQRMARELQASDLIWSAIIVCQGWSATAGGEPGHAGNAWALEHDVRTSFASA
ncbi:MAG: hypothetical protein CVU22_16970 [Betaproteobacteria bacterium HGW-Betaproteobacteria-16]|nr:MAG: hypothetical protein CVU22_16970 [Betaproteobacteria bacterium HGW-Betaproteobacteria-16]